MPLIKRFLKGGSGVTVYGLTAAALMLIGVAGWIFAPPVVASPQTRINPLEMMANAGDLPTPHYDYYDTVFSSDHAASLVESPKKKQRHVNKSHRFPTD
jgi:hypothetical protein